MNNLIQRWRIVQYTYFFHIHENLKFGEFSRNVRTVFIAKIFVFVTCWERAPGITSKDTSKSAISKHIRRNVKYYTVKAIAIIRIT
jgi:hypothetical protein